MSDTDTESNGPDKEYGPRLAAYIDQLRGETSVRQFADEHGLSAMRISTWAHGGRPSLPHIRQTADALGLSFAEVLVIMGVAAADEFTIRVPAELSERAAIAAASADALTDDEWTLVREYVAMLHRMRDEGVAVTVTPLDEPPGPTSRLSPGISSLAVP